MDFRDIEVIMIDDCSTDNSKKIMEEYSNKYPNFISLYHKKNSGRAAIPRNTGLQIASGEYIMFLDPDDEYAPDICERLYDTIQKYDADVVFGRYVRIYDYKENVEKSDSPYPDNIENIYSNMTFDRNSSSKISNIINYLIERIFYGKKPTYPENEIIDTVNITNINQDPYILKIAPSVWTKIYKKELIFNNNITFPPFRLGEDSAFVLETLLKANGIIFLNNFISCFYSVRDSDDDKSVSKTINFKLLNEGIDNPIYCSKATVNFSNQIRVFAVNPHLVFWFSLWRQSNLTKEENKQLINKLDEIKKFRTIHLGQNYYCF